MWDEDDDDFLCGEMPTSWQDIAGAVGFLLALAGLCWLILIAMEAIGVVP